MKILIVSTFFPPLNSIASLRPYSWAKYWAKAGHDVTVLTTAKWPQPSDSPQSTSGFNLIIHPIPGAKLFLRALGIMSQTRNGAEVLSQSQENGRARHANLFYRLLNKLRWRYGVAFMCRMPDYHDLWALRAYATVADREWDVVVSCAGPYSVHWIGYFLRRKGKTRKWIADWRDLWTDHHVFPGLPWLRWLERRIERRFCTVADVLTTVSPHLSYTLQKKYGDKVTVVYNGFDTDDLRELPTNKVFADDRVFRIVYTGTLYPGRQYPTLLFQAVQKLHNRGLLSPDRLQLIFTGAWGDPRELAHAIGVGDYVRYLGFLPRPEALCLQRDADALLFLEFESENSRGILTGKVFEYLFAGPPILAIGKPAEATELVLKTGRGWSLGQDVEAIARWIEAALARQLPPLPAATQSLSLYERRTQAAALLALIESADLRQTVA